jgi:hypothetical protein
MNLNSTPGKFMLVPKLARQLCADVPDAVRATVLSVVQPTKQPLALMTFPEI